MKKVVYVALSLGCLILLLGCQENEFETGIPQSVDREVLVVSQPEDASAFFNGRRVGQTPMKFLIRDDTNLVLEKEGYIRQALLLNSKSAPTVVVKLVKTHGGLPLVHPQAIGGDSPIIEKSAPVPPKPHKKFKREAEPIETAQNTPIPPPQNMETGTTPLPAPSQKIIDYQTMREIKTALRQGMISKVQYRQIQAKIREKRAADISALRKALDERKITRDQYNRLARKIKLKYEGD
jgi:hypothetical protein